MPLLISSPRHKYRRFLIDYQQGRIILFALACFIGSTAYSQEKQVQELRKDARALYDILREYRWERSGPLY